MKVTSTKSFSKFPPYTYTYIIFKTSAVLEGGNKIEMELRSKSENAEPYYNKI